MIEENDLPDNWDVEIIGDVSVEMNTGSTPSRSNEEFWKGNVKWAKAGEISSANKYITDTEEYVTGKANQNTYNDEYVFVTIIGANLSSTVLPTERMGINQQNVAIKLRNDINREYFFYYIRSIADYLKNLGRGGGQQAINQTVLGDVKIPVPPFDEQERIVEVVEERLERAKRLEKSIQSVRQLSTEYEDSIMAYVFSDLDFNSKESAKNLPEAEDIPNSWELTTLGDMAYFQNGNGFSKSQWEEEGKPIIRIQNLTGTGDSYNYFSGEVHDRYAVENGDILFSWSGTIDAFRWTGGDAWLNQHIYRVDVEDGVEEKYLFYLLKRCANILEKRKVGGTLQHIRKGDVTGLQVPLPPKKEQCKIVERLESIDFSTLEKGVTDTNELLTEYRESILSRAFQDTPEADL